MQTTARCPGGTVYQDLRAGKLPLLPAYTASFQKMLRDMMHPNPQSRPSAEAILGCPLLAPKPSPDAASKGFAPLQFQLTRK